MADVDAPHRALFAPFSTLSYLFYASCVYRLIVNFTYTTHKLVKSWYSLMCLNIATQGSQERPSSRKRVANRVKSLSLETMQKAVSAEGTLSASMRTANL